MSSPTQTPALTPQFCFSTRTLRDFLRLSRAQVDDSITTNLNALLTPSTTSPFNPSSTSTISQRPPSNSSSRASIPPKTAQAFLHTTLFPTWIARDTVLRYCSAVATSADPDDPEAVEREATNRAAENRIVDERLDPYSARFFPREARTEMLAALIRNEDAVEGIVRTRTWGTVVDRCEGLEGTVWEKEMEKWRNDGMR